MKKRFLFISPHPDDVELGIGGSVVKLKQQGHRVFIIDLTSGEPTPFGSPSKRKKETERATKILGVDKRINLNFENRYLFDSKELRLAVAEKIRIFKPDIVFCPYPEDAHPDHIAAAKLIEGARFYAKYTKTSLGGKPHYPYHLFYYYCAHLRIVPEISFLIDISAQFKVKEKAMRCYRSQFIDNPKNRFIFDYTESKDSYLGKLIGADYAEAIYSKEVVKIDNLANIL